MTKSVFILAGDGIGPEIIAEARRVLDYVIATTGEVITVTDGLVGGASYDVHGEPLTDATLDQAIAANAVLFGAIGGPKWDGKTDYDKRPEQGLLNLRQGLNAFANLRSAVCFPAMADASSLKREFIEGLDILFVRELMGGVYFGQPRGIDTLADGSRVGYNTQRYTDWEIERVARVAFEMARKRDNRVTSVEKANVMESGVLWREVVTALQASDYPDVALDHMYADNCAMQLVKQPKQFDVILTDNLFGDLLSDAAAMLTGSLGMLPSASLSGDGPGLYEPIHGSAPDIAGKGIANPIATVLSLAMAFRYSLGMKDMAERIENAVSTVLKNGIRTGDIMDEGCTKVNTRGMGDAILAELEKN